MKKNGLFFKGNACYLEEIKNEIGFIQVTNMFFKNDMDRNESVLFQVMLEVALFHLA